MRLYYGTYGHHLSGKLYVYWGDDNLRTGEQVVAPVTNKKSGKTYNTMFTIARAQSEKNAEGEVSRLNQDGIFIKTISGRGLLALPGGKGFDTKIEWKSDSEKRYREKFGLPPLESSDKKSTAPKTKKKDSTRKRIAQALKSLASIKENEKDSVTEKAKSALLSNKKSAADSFKQTKQENKSKQREAFKED